MSSKATALSGFAAAAALVALVIASAALASSPSRQPSSPGGMMGSRGNGYSGMMSIWHNGGGMMGGARAETSPGDDGFAPGTASSPRVVRIVAGPGYAFAPSTVSVVRGETVLFVITAMGPEAHEFMVGPADVVASDTAGTPEAADISMMATKSVSYTFVGPGPYAYACHAPGHYEAGMRGAITVAG